MALPLPDLDDRTFADLVDEARARIVTDDPQWTNHNVSDPGITLIELFAWLTEMLVYRADQVPDRHVRTFLALLNGPDWVPGDDVSEDVRRTVIELRRRYRAVTGADYEYLAARSAPGVARTRCVPRRNLDFVTEAERIIPQPGHVSVIVVASGGGQPDEELIEAVQDYLEPRRLLTARVHVVGPVYAPVNAEVLVARRSDARPEDVRRRVVEELEGFLHPLTGGADGTGWPFGRDVYLSEIFDVLGRIPEVDHVPDVVLSSTCRAGALRCVPAAPVLSATGDPIGLGLAAHHLPQALVDLADVVVGTSFVPIELVIGLRPVPADARGLASVKAAVKRFLHPLHGGPNGASSRTITGDDVAAVIEQTLGTRPEELTVEWRGDAAHAVRHDQAGPVIGVRVQAGELVDAEVTVVVSS